MTIRTKAKVFIYPGEAANWHFVSLTDATAEKIAKSQEGKRRAGWGAVKVKATIGKTAWETSVFPEKGSKAYLLPLKKSVRKAEEILDGDTISISLELL